MSVLAAVLLPSLHHNLLSTLPHTTAAVAAAASMSLAGELFDDLGELSPRAAAASGEVPSEHDTNDVGALSLTSQAPMLSSTTVGPNAQLLHHRLQHLSSSPAPLDHRSTAPTITPSPQHQQRTAAHNTTHFRDEHQHSYHHNHHHREDNSPRAANGGGAQSAHREDYQWASSSEVPRVFGSQSGYLGTLPPIEQVRSRLWFGCLECCVLPPRPSLSIVNDSTTMESGEDARRALYDALALWCDNATLPVSNVRGGPGVGATKPTAQHHSSKLSTVRTSAKSLALLLSEVLKPADVVEGCSYVIADLRRQILDDPASSVVERSEAATIAALAVYIKWFWSPLAPMPSEQAGSQQHQQTADPSEAGSFEGTVENDAQPAHINQNEIQDVLLAHIQAAVVKALDVLHHAVYNTEFVIGSLTQASSSSRVSIDATTTPAAEMFSAVGKVIRVRDALSFQFQAKYDETMNDKGEYSTAAASSSAVAAATSPTTNQSSTTRFDVAGALTRPNLSDTSMRLGAPSLSVASTATGDHQGKWESNSSSTAAAAAAAPLYQTDVSIPVAASVALNPLRHFQGTARPSPFASGASASSVCLVSVGSKCVLLGEASKTQVTTTSFSRGQQTSSTVAPTTTSFTTVFGTSSVPRWWRDNAFSDAVLPSAVVPLGGNGGSSSSSSLQGGGGGGSYFHAVVAKGLKNHEDEVDSPFLVAAASVASQSSVQVGGALHFFDLSTSEQLHAASSLRNNDDISGERVSWNQGVVPGRDHRSHRLEYLDASHCHNNCRVYDATNPRFSIRSIAPLDYGVACVGPVLRLVGLRDILSEHQRLAAQREEDQALRERRGQHNVDEEVHVAVGRGNRSPVDASRILGSTEASSSLTPSSAFLKFVPRMMLSTTYALAESVTASALCSFGGSLIATGRGDEVSLWDPNAAAEIAYASVSSWLRSSCSSVQPDDAGASYITTLVASAEDHCLCVGTAGGHVALWDVRSKNTSGPSRLFRAVPERCGRYVSTCAVQQLRFGGKGIRSIFVCVPSDAAASQLRLYRTGYEQAPAWQSPAEDPDCEVSRFDVGQVGLTGRPYLHVLTRTGQIMGGDVDFLAG
ncbi:Hypothetical protein, putative [Bodo saltans]|uniref:Uncharacterized protein n=1 Tax=Bodo saltans TaxID=75058 RepID=A0A0S4JU59_BODSA|nr:Hypothetical protein, putative [Bodo saltans]|eukprot:CUG93933.1 Hypothetical protein, putative [Bodo saltans]